MADDIRTLSAALARDPSSLQYIDLAEALRRRGKLSEALQVVTHGLGRHPEHADGYDCLARIQSDLGDLAEARGAWERVLSIVPEHIGALKGIGFLYYRQGDTKRAVDALEHALAASPGDDATARALAVIRQSLPSPQSPQDDAAHPVRQTRPVDVPQLRATASAMLAEQMDAAERGGDAPGPEVPGASRASRAPRAPAASGASAAPARPPVFAGLEGATNDILLLDARGLVMAGGLKSAAGGDVSELAAAALAGVSGEATRTAGYLHLGTWTAIVAEAEQANVILAPVGEGAMLMLRRERSTPVGLAVRIAERARAAASLWLAEHS